MTLLADLVETSATLSATSSRRAKVAALADLLRVLDPDEIVFAVAWLTGAPRQGRIGVAWARASTLTGLAGTAGLAIGDLDDALTRLEACTGPGSEARRAAIIDDLGGSLTAEEAAFVRALLTGELRQGALAGLMSDAIAAAADVPTELVRRAAMLSGDLPETARRALTGGATALEQVHLAVGVGIQPMLAATATDVADALSSTGPASVEWKLDGVRIQAHRLGDLVHLYTRNLNDVTDRMPSVVAELRALPVESVVLDGEVIGVSEQGLPEAFQDSASTFGRRTGPGPVTLDASWFDIVHLDGRDLIDEPLETRLAAMDTIPTLRRIPSVRTDDAGAAQRLLDVALTTGHEGVMVKSLASPYAAGRRGRAWRKVKPVHTLDLVVLAVEWGSGRRRGLLSNLHLGALGADGLPVMVGKTFKGLTDELLAWQTDRFLGLETHRDGHVVFVRPEQVVEIALDGAQVSTRYPGGVALRFARVRRYRDDKAAAEADTLDAVRELLPRARR
ncbi:MAG TPA: ATP-dependent DNA ligase [Acidimicrobiia bacterium]